MMSAAVFLAQLADILHWRVKFEIFNALPNKQKTTKSNDFFMCRFLPLLFCYGRIML